MLKFGVLHIGYQMKADWISTIFNYQKWQKTENICRWSKTLKHNYVSSNNYASTQVGW